MYVRNPKNRKIIKENSTSFSSTGNEILYIRREYNSKVKLIKFSLNLVIKIKTEINEMQYEIVRFDCAHQGLHMHRFYRKPPTTEKIGMEISLATLNILADEIRTNWNTWVNAFFENYGDDLK